MAYLPYENTKVSEQASMMEVMTMLEMTGFDKTAHVNSGGQRVIFAAYKGAEFQFAIEQQPIVDAMVKNLSARRQSEIRQKSPRGRAAMENVMEQSRRVGWRLMAIHVKALCDSIKLGVVGIAQAFGGNLIIGKDHDRSITLAEHLTLAIETGKLESPGFLRPLALAAPEEREPR
jgi:hypothetical protein